MKVYTLEIPFHSTIDRPTLYIRTYKYYMIYLRKSAKVRAQKTRSSKVQVWKKGAHVQRQKLAVPPLLFYPISPVLAILSWQPCPDSPVLAPCSACPVLPLQFILSCSTFSCSACPVPPVLFCFFLLCLFLFCLTCLAVLIWLSSPF